ncbi:MAG: efflux RND transporter periplasmic adaptor subunit [Deltaproteobacteria bacterium]|nr:efflux RND transporter periplasmic adaptor subunit [Deltaproteobacteria bacterium]
MSSAGESEMSEPAKKIQPDNATKPVPDGHAPGHDGEHMPEGEEEAPHGTRAAAIVRWVIILSVAAVAAFTVGKCIVDSAAGPSAESQTVWTCPMHPQIVQNEPGECPICGMDLVPKQREAAHEDHANADGGVAGLVPVTISEERIQSSGIRTTKAVRKSLEGGIRTLGTVAPDERRFADVTARVPGWLGSVRVAAVGDRVRRGQLLASIESPDVLAASRELVQLRSLGSTQALAGADLAAPVRQRLELLGLPRGQIDRIERTGQPVGAVPISAPIAGTVIARSAIPGSYVDRGAPLYQIGDLSTVWVLVDVYPRDLPRVSVGQHAVVQLEGGAAPPVEGTVTYLYPTTDLQTRTTRVRIELQNTDGRIRPGLFAEVTLHAPPVDAVVVPSEAVASTGEQEHVFVATGGGRFEPRRVRTGTRSGAEVAIVEGLAEGEEVVSSSAFLLDSESRLRSAIQGGGGSAGGGHQGHGQ